MRVKLESIAIVLILIASVSRLLIPQINGTMLFVVFPMLFIWRVYSDANLFKNKGIAIYSLLLLWLFVAVAFAENYSQAMNSISPILGAYLLSVVFYSMSRKQQKSAYWIMFSYWLLVFAALYYLNSVGLVGDAIDTLGEERLGDEKVNANDIAYYLFYVASSFVLIFWGKTNSKYAKVVVVIGFIALLYLIFQMSLLTASRQILVLVLPVAIFSMLFYLSKGKQSQFVVMCIVTVLVFYGIGNRYLSTTLEDSYLMTRMETDIKDDGRTYLLKRAIEVGCEHPIVGVGPGNFINYTGGTFSHSSYTELFACAGLPGLTLFVMVVIYFIVQQWRYYQSTRESRFLFLFIFGLVWAIYNFMYAFYLGVWLMPFLFCLWGYSENIYSKMKK